MESKETSHHKWELTIIEILNSDGWELYPSWTKTEHYDAIGKTPKGFNCVMELKLRHKYYPTKVLEVYKYEKLMEIKDFLKFYYVFDIKGNYLYLLDTLVLPEKTIINCKTTEKFGNEELIDKSVYMISENQASVINKY
jgi:hypothetical protein